MARPKKAEHEKRNKRLTYYMTEDEEAKLTSVADHLGIEKTKCISQALEAWIKALENPPEKLVQASHESIMKSSSEPIYGFICSKGHLFWIDWSWPSPPIGCPCCGNRLMKQTWPGKAEKGF